MAGPSRPGHTPAMIPDRTRRAVPAAAAPSEDEHKTPKFAMLIRPPTQRLTDHDDENNRRTIPTRGSPRAQIQAVYPASQPRIPSDENHGDDKDYEDGTRTLYDILIELGTNMVQNGKKEKYWTGSILRRALTENNIKQALSSCGGFGKHRINWLCGQILRSPDPVSDTDSRTFIKIFALLVLCDKPKTLEAFLCPETGGGGVCDNDLPLEILDRKGVEPRLPDDKGRSFEGWTNKYIDDFRDWQYSVCPHYFGGRDDGTLGGGGGAPHYELSSKIVLPFISCGDAGDFPEDNIGAFGEVFKYRIPPDCHGFAPILLRKLHKGRVDKPKDFLKTFKHEADQLRRFNGDVSPHLVTLLATYWYRDDCFFVFPFAECNLCRYWEKYQPPSPMTGPFVRWFAKQLYGIVAAVGKMHNPGLPTYLTGDVEKFGRHGDIKPDNILWYESIEDVNGIFVIADLGNSRLNSVKSRSNIPGENVPPVPGYRPPECDIKAKMVSRLFDVWTLGCLFLEMITWFLGGEELRDEFDVERSTESYVTGARTNQFYNIMPGDDEKGLIQFVKPEVTQWIDKLRRHEKGTQFTLDVLDIIQHNMLVVQGSPFDRRLPSTELVPLFKAKLASCSSGWYCESPLSPEQQRRLAEASSPYEPREVGVRIELSKKVWEQMYEAHRGDSGRSLRPGGS